MTGAADAGVADRRSRSVSGWDVMPPIDPPHQANPISFTSSDETGSAASSMSTNMPHDLYRRKNRHPQGR